MTLRKKDPSGLLSQSFFFFLHACMHAKLVQFSPALCDPMDCNPPGSSVHGILQARILEWVAMPSFRRSSWLRYRTRFSSVSCLGKQFLYYLCHLGSLTFFLHYILWICTARLFDSSIYLFIYQFLKVSCVGKVEESKVVLSGKILHSKIILNIYIGAWLTTSVSGFRFIWNH